jgi:hypothetical protein
MATEKKFAVAGVSTQAGKTKVRFANDSTRIKILVKNGHTDIELVDLPHEMTKAEIAEHMHSTGFGQGNPAILAAIKDLAKKNKVKLVEASTQATAVTAEAVTAE